MVTFTFYMSKSILNIFDAIATLKAIEK